MKMFGSGNRKYILYVRFTTNEEWICHGTYDNKDEALEALYNYIDQVDTDVYYKIRYSGQTIDSGYIGPN